MWGGILAFLVPAIRGVFAGELNMLVKVRSENNLQPVLRRAAQCNWQCYLERFADLQKCRDSTSAYHPSLESPLQANPL